MSIIISGIIKKWGVRMISKIIDAAKGVINVINNGELNLECAVALKEQGVEIYG